MNIGNRRIKDKQICEYIIVGIFLITISIMFSYLTGILNSGYHLTDDHEIIVINEYINNNGLFSAIVKFIGEDLSWRYRPLYFFVRVVRTYFFKTNFFIWHLVISIECGIYMFLSYILARKMKAPIIISIIFSFIFLIGTQDEIIWRMGPQENMGMVFLPLSFLFLINYYKNNTRKNLILSEISIALLMLCKESFLLLAPSFIIFMFYLYSLNKATKTFFNLLANFIKEYKTFIICIFAVMIINLGIIFFYVGLLKSGYAGVDTSYTIGEYIRITLNVFIRDLKDYWIIIGAVLFIETIDYINKTIKKITVNFSESFSLLIFVFYSLVVEAFLYAKSVMADRYKLPLLWVLYFSVFVLQQNKIKKPYHTIAILLITIYIFNTYNFSNIINRGSYYAEDGKKITEMFSDIGELSKDNNELIVLTDFYWYEHNDSSSKYLQIQEKVKNVYYLDREKYDGEYKKIYNTSDKRIKVSDADVIITDDFNIDYYDDNNYEIVKYFNYYLLKKK